MRIISLKTFSWSMFLVSFLTIGCKINSESKLNLVGGSEVSLNSEFVYSTVKLKIRVPNGTNFCSATIIGPNQLITAGHCFGEEGRLVAVLNEINPTEITSLSNFQHKVHEQYDSQRLINDLALITFDGVLPATMQPVRVGTSNMLASGNTIIYAGYGIRSDNSQDYNNPLQFVETTIKSLLDADKKFQDVGNGKSHCTEDSGGPVYAKNQGQLTLVGVISHGTAAGCSEGFGFNTNITLFQGWIQTTFQSMGKTLPTIQTNENINIIPNQDLNTNIEVPQLPDPVQVEPSAFGCPLCTPTQNSLVCVEHDMFGNCTRFLN